MGFFSDFLGEMANSFVEGMKEEFSKNNSTNGNFFIDMGRLDFASQLLDKWDDVFLRSPNEIFTDLENITSKKEYDDSFTLSDGNVEIFICIEEDMLIYSYTKNNKSLGLNYNKLDDNSLLGLSFKNGDNPIKQFSGKYYSDDVDLQNTFEGFGAYLEKNGQDFPINFFNHMTSWCKDMIELLYQLNGIDTQSILEDDDLDDF